MKTDILFYELIQEFPQIFFEVILGRSGKDSRAYEFRAPEIKQPSFRLDGLFATRAGFESEPLYFLEFQTYTDEEFYDRFFAEIFLYFRQYRPPNKDWYGIVVYDRRSHEVEPHSRYEVLMERHVRRIYLKELQSDAEESLGIGILKLFVEIPTKTGASAKQLIAQARTLPDDLLRKKTIQFIHTLVVYKLTNRTQEEIEAMLDLEPLKGTRFYESVLEQGRQEMKLKMVQGMLRQDFSIQEIAKILEMNLEEVREIARQFS